LKAAHISTSFPPSPVREIVRATGEGPELALPISAFIDTTVFLLPIIAALPLLWVIISPFQVPEFASHTRAVSCCEAWPRIALGGLRTVHAEARTINQMFRCIVARY
jgi:hypothetical protein